MGNILCLCGDGQKKVGNVSTTNKGSLEAHASANVPLGPNTGNMSSTANTQAKNDESRGAAVGVKQIVVGEAKTRENSADAKAKIMSGDGITLRCVANSQWIGTAEVAEKPSDPDGSWQTPTVVGKTHSRGMFRIYSCDRPVGQSQPPLPLRYGNSATLSGGGAPPKDCLLGGGQLDGIWFYTNDNYQFQKKGSNYLRWRIVPVNAEEGQVIRSGDKIRLQLLAYDEKFLHYGKNNDDTGSYLVLKPFGADVDFGSWTIHRWYQK